MSPRRLRFEADPQDKTRVCCVTAPDQREHFVDRLALTPIDRDIFTGICHSGAPLRAYGGQIAAQALMAAGRTVEESDRRVHSLHGYFLRPGRTKDTITYLVDRPRDGRSFSTRIVRAVQHGETIFMMTSSFSVVDPGPHHKSQSQRSVLYIASDSSDNTSVPGIYLCVAAGPGDIAAGMTVFYGSYAVAPRSPYTLTLKSPLGQTTTTLASGVTSTGGHVEAERQLPALTPGLHKIVFTGYSPGSTPLALTNHIRVSTAGTIVSISPESSQPTLK